MPPGFGEERTRSTGLRALLETSLSSPSSPARPPLFSTAPERKRLSLSPERFWAGDEAKRKPAPMAEATRKRKRGRAPKPRPTQEEATLKVIGTACLPPRCNKKCNARFLDFMSDIHNLQLSLREPPAAIDQLNALSKFILANRGTNTSLANHAASLSSREQWGFVKERP